MEGGDAVPQDGERLSRQRRWRALGHGGLTVWFTGLHGSGKSTLARALELRLVARRRPACVLDEEELAQGLDADVAGTPQEEAEAVRRTAHVAALVADAGFVAIAAIVSPQAADRERARAIHERAWLTFFEVHVDTPLRVCEDRDPKGLYTRARRGEVVDVPGLDVPYEPPAAPELVVDTAGLPGETADEVLAALGFGAGAEDLE